MAGIYIHIPFCVQKCSYCNFYSIANSALKSDFLIALAQEIELQKADFEHEIIETIYFGGGTPSLLSADEISSILNLLFTHYRWGSDVEITLEANPDDLSWEYLSQLAKTKVNRLSIGVQSFNEDTLKQINRRHSAGQAIESIENAQKAGFSNLSIDLIYGIPGQNDEQWLKNLSLAAKLEVSHLSCYALTVEEHTVLHKKIETHRAEAPNEDDAVRQFDLLMDFASVHGFHQYEISNYCTKNLYSRHNRAYWEGLPYLGFGPGAHSFYRNIRKWNYSNVTQYIKGMSDGSLISEEEVLTLRDQFNEYLLIALRTDVGVDFGLIETRFGARYADWVKSQLDKVDSAFFLVAKNHLNLTQIGKHWADYVTRELFMEEC